jgi:hypothetical protein
MGPWRRPTSCIRRCSKKEMSWAVRGNRVRAEIETRREDGCGATQTSARKEVPDWYGWRAVSHVGGTTKHSRRATSTRFDEVFFEVCWSSITTGGFVSFDAFGHRVDAQVNMIGTPVAHSERGQTGAF